MAEGYDHTDKKNNNLCAAFYSVACFATLPLSGDIQMRLAEQTAAQKRKCFFFFFFFADCYSITIRDGLTQINLQCFCKNLSV